MNELDDIWPEMLSKALEKARGSGRHDVADYLTLKATNDELRKTGSAWLNDTMLEIAGAANRKNAGISIERQEPHNFSWRGANMAGSLLRLRYGVRCLTLEVGWTRTPADGFMRGGALAFARFKHFGMAKQNAEIVLLQSNSTPAWHVYNEEKAGAHFRSESMLGHFRIFLSE
ncbi:MAG: hypothetical protein WKF92_10070 [Pyrinomonadaceae bacterium]